MDYRFNYRFLKEWLIANPEYKVADIMRCLSSKDYASVNRYAEGAAAPSLEHIVRLTNMFQIPMTSWFIDLSMEAPADPSICAPTEGFSNGNDKGGRKRLSPEVKEHVCSKIPQMTTPTYTNKETITNEERDKLLNDITQLHLEHERELDSLKRLHDSDLTSEKKRHKKSLKEAADRHVAERLTLTDIIKDQQSVISRQEETIARLMRMMESQGYNVGMAAEPEPN